MPSAAHCKRKPVSARKINSLGHILRGLCVDDKSGVKINLCSEAATQPLIFRCIRKVNFASKTFGEFGEVMVFRSLRLNRANNTSSNSFLGQERPGVLKLGPISIGMTTDGQQLGVITFRLLSVSGQLCRMGAT